MIFTTTGEIAGHHITTYHGIVVGEGVIGGSVVSAMSSSVATTDGRGPASYEMDLKKARDAAMQEVRGQAEKFGANAVVGVDIDYATAGHDNGMLLVVVSGTAVSTEHVS